MSLHAGFFCSRARSGFLYNANLAIALVFFASKKREPVTLLPGRSKARDEADYDRITGANKDNRNLGGCRLGCRCRWSVRRDYRDFTAYKIGSHYLEAIILTPSPLVVYRDVLTLDITAFIESMEIQSADALPLSATSSANNSESRADAIG